jgi:hypothetical protein
MSPQPGNTDTAVVSSTAHLKEYFIPRDSISRDVISADIRLYLGNDALLRPGICIVCDEWTILFCTLVALTVHPLTAYLSPRTH